MEYSVSLAALLGLMALLGLWLIVRKYNTRQVEVVESEPVRLPGDEAIMKHAGALNGHPMARCAKTGEFAHPDYLRSVTQHPPRGDRRRASDGWT